ncbi:MAG: hypothetical protein R3C29_03030 [Dehalococcoidia bacterium]
MAGLEVESAGLAGACSSRQSSFRWILFSHEEAYLDLIASQKSLTGLAVLFGYIGVTFGTWAYFRLQVERKNRAVSRPPVLLANRTSHPELHPTGAGQEPPGAGIACHATSAAVSHLHRNQHR